MRESVFGFQTQVVLYHIDGIERPQLGNSPVHEKRVVKASGNGVKRRTYSPSLGSVVTLLNPHTTTNL